jgi:non-heme chloroperoxidase
MLVMLGDDDQIVSCADADRIVGKACEKPDTKGFPHGMPTTEAATINADLLAFLKA